VASTTSDCEKLTRNISESFGLISSALRKSMRIPVRVSYLVFKKLDVIEDNSLPFDKQEIFNQVITYLEESVYAKKSSPDMSFIKDALMQVSAHIPRDNKQDWLSIKNYEKILCAYNKLDLDDKKAILKSAKEMTTTMLLFQNKILLKGGQFVKSFEELSDYSHGVAGVVGNSLTNIFMNHDKKNEDRYRLLLEKNGRYNRSEETGIFLQYVNIIKDKKKDENNKQHFWPSESEENYLPVTLEEMVNHAKEYFDAAKEYIATLPRENFGARVFSSAALLKAFYELKSMIKHDDTERGRLSGLRKTGLIIEALRYTTSNRRINKLAISN